jgi:hypothetical protein
MLTKTESRRISRQRVPALVCAACGATGVRLERHHHDYQKPLDVEILCSRCHHYAHSLLGVPRAKQLAARACAVCYQMFQPVRSASGVLCGRAACNQIYGRLNAAKRWAGRPTTRACGVCHETFSPKRPRQLNCGRACGNRQRSVQP